MHGAVLGLVCLLSLAGCADLAADPSVSVSYSHSESTQNGRKSTTTSATLTAANDLADWSELAVTGCRAPDSGPIETPHKFAGCDGRLVIKHVASGDTLYDSGSSPQW